MQSEIVRVKARRHEAVSNVETSCQKQSMVAIRYFGIEFYLASCF